MLEVSCAFFFYGLWLGFPIAILGSCCLLLLRLPNSKTFTYMSLPQKHSTLKFETRNDPDVKPPGCGKSNITLQLLGLVNSPKCNKALLFMMGNRHSKRLIQIGPFLSWMHWEETSRIIKVSQQTRKGT